MVLHKIVTYRDLQGLLENFEREISAEATAQKLRRAIDERDRIIAVLRETRAKLKVVEAKALQTQGVAVLALIRDRKELTGNIDSYRRQFDKINSYITQTEKIITSLE